MHLLLTIATLLLTAPSASASTTDSYQHLISWVQDNGGNVENIKIGHSTIPGAGRALATMQPRDNKEVLVSVPNHLLITDVVAQADSLFQQHVLSFDLSIAPCLILSLYLLIETLIRSSSSKWIKYLRTLPPTDHDFNLPQFDWPSTPAGREALEVLQTSPSIAARMRDGNHIHELALSRLNETVFPSLKRSHPHLTNKIILETFTWAGSIVLTRSWSDESIPGECTMVPVLDLLNHHDEAKGLFALAFNGSNTPEAVGAVAEGRVESESELMASYDPASYKCMQEMLLNFGFLPRDSRRPWCLSVRFDLRLLAFQDPELDNLARMLLARAGTGSGAGVAGVPQYPPLQEYTIELKEDDVEIPAALMAVLRVSMSTEKEMRLIQKRGHADGMLLTLHHERTVLKIIHDTVSQMLASIPSTEREDEERMLTARREGKEKNMAVALEVRIHERRICQQTLERVEKLCVGVMMDDTLWE